MSDARAGVARVTVRRARALARSGAAAAAAAGVGARVPRRRAPSLELDAQPAARPLLGLAGRRGRDGRRARRVPRAGRTCGRSCASAGTCRPARCSSNPSSRRRADDVCTDGGTLTVNGAPLGAVATEDTRGRPLPHDERCGPLPDGDVFVASHSPTSFDSRTFGPVPALRPPRNGDAAMDLLTDDPHLQPLRLRRRARARDRRGTEQEAIPTSCWTPWPMRPRPTRPLRRRAKPRRRPEPSGLVGPGRHGRCSACSSCPPHGSRPSADRSRARSTRAPTSPSARPCSRSSTPSARRARGAAGQAPRSLERVNRRACVLRKYEAAIGSDDFAEAILLELSVQRRDRTLHRRRTHLRSRQPRATGVLTSCSCTCPSPAPATPRLAACLSALFSASLLLLPRPPHPRAPRRDPFARCASSSPKSPASPAPSPRRCPRRRGERRCTSSAAAGDVVAWCAGHILQMAPPEAYGDAYKTWRLEHLPIAPREWKLEVSAPELLRSIARLLKRREARSCTRATRIAKGSCSSTRCSTFSATAGPVDRLLVRDLSPEAVRAAARARSSPTRKYRPLYESALARQRADWLYGMNMTRLYTLLGRAGGLRGRAVGRARADAPSRAHRRARPRHRRVSARPLLRRGGGDSGGRRGELPGRLGPGGRGGRSTRRGACSRASVAEAARERVGRTRGARHRVHRGERRPRRRRCRTRSPTCRWTRGGALAMSAAGGARCLPEPLRDAIGSLTYPRSDCAYLPEGQLAQAPDVLAAIGRQAPALGPAQSRRPTGPCAPGRGTTRRSPRTTPSFPRRPRGASAPAQLTAPSAPSTSSSAAGTSRSSTRRTSISRRAIELEVAGERFDGQRDGRPLGPWLEGALAEPRRTTTRRRRADGDAEQEKERGAACRRLAAGRRA